MPLTAEAVAALAAKGLTLATEATTGGLIGHLLTESPSSSRVFRGGVAPYANALKRTIAVPASLLAEHGAVSGKPPKRWASSPGWPLLDRAGHRGRRSQRALRLRGRPLRKSPGLC